MDTNDDITGDHDLASYQIHARREIANILHAVQTHKQMLTLSIRAGSQSGMTSILQVDREGDTIVVDLTCNAELNRNVLQSNPVYLQTMLDNIRISFEVEHVEECLFDGKLALVFPLPQALVRLQRREHYRVATPRAVPVQCEIHVPENVDHACLSLPLVNVSGGGVAIVDEQCLLDATIGRIYDDCRISLPNDSFLIVNLQVRNVQSVTRMNGKTMRQIGCLFVELPRPMLATVQRYITALEFQQNAKA